MHLASVNTNAPQQQILGVYDYPGIGPEIYAHNKKNQYEWGNISIYRYCTYFNIMSYMQKFNEFHSN